MPPGRGLLAVVALVALGVGASCSRSHEADARRVAAKVSADATASVAAAPPARATTAGPLSCRALEGCTDACADPRCAEACVHRLTAAARPAYDTLQACVVPACSSGATAPCRAPGSFACKMCVLQHCASQASGCMAH